MSKIACLFPGQGSQSVGMGLDLFNTYEEARSSFNLIDSLAGRLLSRLCFEGPEQELKRTINTQPTILAVSLAAWRCYQLKQGPEPAFLAGHSLGEFSALVAGRVLSLETAVALVERRAKLMEECPTGAMSAVLGLSAELVAECCQAAQAEAASAGSAEPDEVVVVANFNTREQLVISGGPAAVARASERAKAGGGKVIALPVGGAFHSPLMASAAQEFQQELEKHDFSDAQIAVVQNFDARGSRSGLSIKEKLMKQMPSSVRWCESIEHMVSEGVDTFVEIGPGKALAGMVKKICRSAQVFNIYDAASLQSTIDQLRAAIAVS